MGRAEQKEEREVLDSIFPDEITDISDTEYRISILLDVTTESETGPEPPTIILNVKYPETYPDVPPVLDVTQPPNAPKHPFLDIQDDKAQLLETLEPTIEESIGMAMVFALYSTLKDSAEQLIAERQNAEEAVREAEVKKAEEEENRKFEGEKVTIESFLAWSASFKAEMVAEKARQQAEAEAEEKKKRGKLEEKKLTGKQLWQQGLAGKTIEEEEDGEDGLVEHMQSVNVKS